MIKHAFLGCVLAMVFLVPSRGLAQEDTTTPVQIAPDPPLVGAACSVVVATASDVTLGAMQIEIGYSGTGGEFSGTATSVVCENLSGADLMSANDDDVGKILRIGWVSLDGVDAPLQLATCAFEPGAGSVAVSDFQLDVIDAADPDFVPVPATAFLEVVNCATSGIVCGDVTGDGKITAGDSLLLLNAAVGLPAPLNCSGMPQLSLGTSTTTLATFMLQVGAVCGDVNSDGEITAGDALLDLNAAVGLPAPLNCTGTPFPTTTTSTTTTTTTTTVPSVPMRQLTVDKIGSGSGLVTSQPVGINCGAKCTVKLVEGSDVTLKAAPSAGSKFMGWSGDVPPRCNDASSISCSFRMTKRRIATAAFTAVSTGCPTNGPILDFRNDCSSRGYFYASAVEAAGLTTDGVDIPVVVLPRDGGDGVALVGEVTGARNFAWTTACLLDSFGNIDVCGAVPGTGKINSTGQTLTLTLDGKAFNFSFVGSEPLQTVADGSGVGNDERVTMMARAVLESRQLLADSVESRLQLESAAEELVRRVRERF